MKKNKRNNVIKEEHIITTGTVIDCLPGTKFKVNIGNDHIIKCSLSGKLRMNKIMIANGDSVEIEISPYDLNAGIIVWRNK